MENPDLAVVRAVYDAFDRADLTAILDLFSPEVSVYQSPALPWGGSHEGHDGLLHFLGSLASTIASSPVTEYLVADGAGHAVQVGRTVGTVRATGVEFDVFESHIWTIEDGRVRRFEVYLDTEALLAALAQEKSA
jgi:ketosteroid isomerase-like protein